MKEANRGFQHLRQDLGAYAKLVRRAGQKLRSAYEPMAAHGNRLQRLSVLVHDGGDGDNSLTDAFRKAVECRACP